VAPAPVKLMARSGRARQAWNWSSPPACGQPTLGCLHRWAKDAAAGCDALALVIARECTLNLARLAADLERPVSRVVKASRIPRWR